MSSFSCISCDKYFNGRKPYEAHLASEKHKKKVNQATLTTMDSKFCDGTSSSGEVEPFITFRGKEYWCICCKTTLNSISQVKSHISGIKHLKLKISHASELSNEISKLNFSNKYKYNFHFSFNGIEVENVLKDIKVIGVKDAIVF